ncbi:MAG: hypothetical protein Q9181_001657 [Wetmoreana brouardii]
MLEARLLHFSKHGGGSWQLAQTIADAIPLSPATLPASSSQSIMKVSMHSKFLGFLAWVLREEDSMEWKVYDIGDFYESAASVTMAVNVVVVKDMGPPPPSDGISYGLSPGDVYDIAPVIDVGKDSSDVEPDSDDVFVVKETASDDAAKWRDLIVGDKKPEEGI